jgi:hypothetical protein
VVYGKDNGGKNRGPYFLQVGKEEIEKGFTNKAIDS